MTKKLRQVCLSHSDNNPAPPCVPWRWCEDKAFSRPCLVERLLAPAGSPASSQPAACIPVASQTSWVSLSGAEFSGQLILAVSSRAQFCHHDEVPFTLARGFSLCPLHARPLPVPRAQVLAHGQGQGLSYLRKPKASRGAFGPFLPSLGGLGEGISTVPP